MRHSNKKGQVLQTIGGLGIGVVTIAILLAITFIIMTNVKTQGVDMAASVTNTNESINSWTNNTQFQVATSMGGFNVIAISNGSDTLDGEVVSTDCYTSTSMGYLTIFTEIDGVLNCGDIEDTINITYNHKPMDSAFNSTTTLQNATQTIPGWIPLIILVAIGGLILGLVAMFKKD